MVTLITAQVGWVVVGVLDLGWPVAMAASLALGAIELTGPVLAERHGDGTPWHAHHMADRYSALAIITLGEGIIGTVASLSAAVDVLSWGLQTILIVIAGIGLTFGLWWIYFILEPGDVLHRYRARSFAFGYFHIPLFAAIAATGAGLHVAGLWIGGEAKLSEMGVVLAVALPVAAFLVGINVIYYTVYHGADGGNELFHFAMFAASLAVIAIAAAMAWGHVAVGWCLLMTMLAPMVTVVGYETIGHRHLAQDQAALLR